MVRSTFFSPTSTVYVLILRWLRFRRRHNQRHEGGNAEDKQTLAGYGD